jgi:hypothetical protein
MIRTDYRSLEQRPDALKRVCVNNAGTPLLHVADLPYRLFTLTVVRFELRYAISLGLCGSRGRCMGTESSIQGRSEPFRRYR